MKNYQIWHFPRTFEERDCGHYDNEVLKGEYDSLQDAVMALRDLRFATMNDENEYQLTKLVTWKEEITEVDGPNLPKPNPTIRY